MLVSALLTQVFFLALSLAVLHIEGLELLPSEWPAPLGIAGAALFLVVAAGSIPARWRRKTENELRRTALLLPSTPRGLWLHALLCLLAGFGEELTYRGILPVLLAPRLGTGSGAWWLAQGLSIAVFSLAHLVQGWRTIGVIASLTIGIVVVVALSGNLYAAMVAHAVYDFVAGVLWVQRSMRLGSSSSRGG
jgi:membrane protease YdiL (CAAX protease family)